jgi:hypothetical protein
MICPPSRSPCEVSEHWFHRAVNNDGLRADILTTGSPWVRAARITIDAPAQTIFDLLADPRRHGQFDGSGTVLSVVQGPDRLHLGATFAMSMKIKVSYRTVNTVHEFDEGRLIAWGHFNRHLWRYELDPLTDTSTSVTETFDARTALFPPVLRLINAYENNQIAVARTLVRLKRLIESG